MNPTLTDAEVMEALRQTKRRRFRLRAEQVEAAYEGINQAYWRGRAMQPGQAVSDAYWRSREDDLTVRQIEG